MVSNISSNYGYPAMSATTKTTMAATGRYAADIENMVKYLNGQPLTPQDENSIADTLKGSVFMLPIFGGVAAFSPLKANKFNVVKTVRAINANSSIKSRGQAFEAGKSELDAFINKFKKGNAVITETTASKPGFFSFLNKIPGVTKLKNSAVGKAMGKSSLGGWLILGGAIELLTQVGPAFQQGGFSSGLKQIGKSTVKVIGDTLGFVVGEAAGKAIGAAIGTAICPGIGTAIGSFVGGFLCGVTGSALVGKATRLITGKSELEKIQDKQVQETAQQIEADPNAKLKLAQASLEQANQILAQDPENKDALSIKEAAEKTIAELTQPDVQSQMIQNTQDANNQVSLNPWGVPIVPGFNGVGYDMNVYNQFLSNTAALPAINTNSNSPFAMNSLSNPLYQKSTVVA